MPSIGATTPASFGDVLVAAHASPHFAVLLAAAALLLLLAAKVLLTYISHVHTYLRIRSGLAPIPRAPGHLPLLGHAITLLQGTAWDVMHSWLLDSKQPILKYSVLGKQGVVVGDPASAKRIFQTHQRVYDKDLYWAYHHFLDILGTGLVTANGELWQRQRLLIGPVLRQDMLEAVIGMARGAVDRLSAKLERARGTGKVVNMDDEFRLLTLQVIGEAVLSLPPEECDRVFPELYLPAMEEANHRVFQPWRAVLPTPAWWRYRSRIARLNRYLIGIIRARWASRSSGQSPTTPDVLDHILSALEARGEKMTAATEQQLCFELKTFLLAGHETSAAMLSWSLHELMQHPAAMATVKQEAVAAFGKEEAVGDRVAAEGMPYTLSVLKESLRKYTVVPVVVRGTTRDDSLCGESIPKGTLVVMHLQAVHALWKEPSAWRPERFMPGGEYDGFPDETRAYMFLPFIVGPRSCLGQWFALLEARVVLSLLVKRFAFKPLAKDVQRHPSVIPLGPLGGMPVLIE